ncbi:polysaccharide pyruvyl transferase WcaK-like protein [Bacillus tianshenii]|uniref:Polysaccharide pyruvyl transferase WcaK-like protein n=1 Tax=Sutcliffiella tianshenii TaxID=1463404 RepID=A0ABS2P667_9BACI|nr:polysaccharide pyruvyl transferase family protein [Bacillus tianshenii]MBM7622078.1 polysaccharide pyruvyl transferase WcaK-like protein [Bacillus tianshenii]
MKLYNIAQIGTFDVENYGDLLFPNMFYNEMSKRIALREHTLFSPIGGAKPFETNVEVFPMSDLEKKINFFHYDAIVVGGGDIIRNDTEYFRSLWLAKEMGQRYRIPVIWNCVGVPFSFNGSEDRKNIQDYCNQLVYLSVRDMNAQNKLIHAGVKNINVVPDSIINLNRLYRKDTLQKRFLELGRIGAVPAIKDYIALQASPGIFHRENDYEELINTIKNILEKTRLNVVLLSICHCHNDLLLLQKIKSSFPERVFLINQKLNTKDIASVIASSRFFIGTSLHGNITAYSYGVKHLALNIANISKIDGFFDLIHQQEACIHKMKDVENMFFKQIIATEDEDKHYEKRKSQLAQQIDIHFNNIANIIVKGKK